jgi:CheY-like chemotaxis protein
LIAEDGADCAESMATLLRLYSHEVAAVRDGPTALETVQAHQPDVLLLDIGLPGMDGYEAAKRLKEHSGKKRPFIICRNGVRDGGRPAPFGRVGH